MPRRPNSTTVRAEPRFGPGDLVHHRRYKYRGVVVAFDDQCKADNQWYHKNQTQPNRDQPWYHVLVHGSNTVTYVAQTNLEPDDSGEPIDHPYVPIFFSGFDGDRYERNDEPWPGW